MELNEKLLELRKQKGLTQEELAQALYVSRTAISKWESGRGYPNIDSLKRIAKLFSVTIDELLSSDELLSLAEEDHKQKEHHFRNLVFGLLDISAAMLLFLPFFAQKADGVIKAVSLLLLTEISPYLKFIYIALVSATILWGILLLALQNCNMPFWGLAKSKISVALNAIGVLVLIMSLQPYAAVFLFVFLTIKFFVLIKWQ